MSENTDNQGTATPENKIALIVVPEDPSQLKLWCSSFGGMPFILRQSRLCAKANISEIYVLWPAREDIFSDCDLNNQHTPELKLLTYDLNTAGRGNAVSSLPAATQYIVFNIDCVYETSLFTRMAKTRVQGDINNQILTPPSKDNAIWICDKASLGKAVQAVSTHQVMDSNEIVLIASSAFIGRIKTRSEMTALENCIWESCRKDVDGIVSKFLNRHLSLSMSRTIVGTSITPNQVTIFGIFLGLLGAYFVSWGTYWPTLAGAALIKANSIIDGVDGELARMRVQSSLLGEWLDTIGDDLVNISFVVGLGIASWNLDLPVLWVYLATFCAVSMFLVASIYYVWLARMGRGDILSFDWFQEGEQGNTNEKFPDAKATVVAWATRLFRRDLLIGLIFVLALIGATQYILIPLAVASLVTLTALLFKLSNSNSARAVVQDETSK